MAKTKISEFSSTPANNTDIDSINIAEGCAPSGINDAIRELMAQLKDFQTGAQGDSFNGPIGTSTAAAGAFTTLSATGAITSTLATGTAPLVIASTTKVANLNVDLLDGADWASPAALGSTTPAAVSATTLSASSTVTLSGGTANGVAYLNGSKVVTSGSALVFDGTNLGIGTSSPTNALSVTGNANITGNTTLGDATTDTVRVNGYMGVGGAGDSGTSLTINSSVLTGSSQYGVYSNITSSATSNTGAFLSQPQTANSVFTAGNVHGFYALNATLGTGSTITNQYGVRIADLTSGTNNYGITSAVSSGTNKWNIYASGTAANYFAGNVGIGTSSPTSPLHVVGAAGYVGTFDGATDTRIDFKNSGTRNGIIQSSSASFNVNAVTAIPLIFLTSSAERMRLDSSGNLGIGTSSPAVKLHVAGRLRVVENTSIADLGSSATEVYLYNRSNSALTFGTNDTERMRLDSSGNLGLGITPSAWSTAWVSLNIAGNLSLAGRSSNTEELYLSANAFNDGSWKYIASNFATQYYQDAGTHVWRTAPSGTAGNAITFTQALTLSSVGNLLLGGTSDPASAAKAIVIYNGTAPTGNIAGGILYVESGALKYRGSSGTVTTLAVA